MKTMIIKLSVVCALVIIASANVVPSRLQRSANTCGVPKRDSGLIVKGQDIKRGDFPWIVALMGLATGAQPYYFCGGTLISSTFVISAAHCILQKGSDVELPARQVRAIFGAHKLDDFFESGRLTLSPKKITVHKDWNPHIKSYDADISLLEFEAGIIIFNQYVRPICIWESGEEPTATDGVVVGWGKSEDPTREHENEPKLVTVPIQTNEKCFFGASALLHMSSPRTFCAGLTNGSGVCFGDSGGGLFIIVNDVYHLKGVVSSSLMKNGGCDVSTSAIYTNALKFVDWIKKTTEAVLVSSTEDVDIIVEFSYRSDLIGHFLGLIKELSDVTHICRALEALYNKMSWSGDLLKPEVFEVAYLVKKTMERDMGQDTRERLTNLKNKFSRGVQDVMWSSQVCIKSVKRHEYFYAAADGWAYSSSERTVFTWRPNGKDEDMYWRMTPLEDGKKFKITSLRWNEIFYCSDETSDSERRFCFTSRTHSSLNGDQWQLQPVTGDQFRLKNIYYGEYFYASEFERDSERRKLFSWIVKDEIDDTMTWKIEDCSE